MKKLLSIILAITLTLTLFASCGETEKAMTATELLDLGEKYLLDLDYEQAIVYFNQVIEVEPRNARAYMGAAEAYVGLGDTESAVSILKTALDVFSDDEEVTIEILEMLIEIDPTTAEWYLDLAQIYINQGNTDKAIEILEKGMANAIETAEIEVLLAELLPEEEPEVEEETVEVEPAYETTAVYYYNSDESVSCSYVKAIAVIFSWDAVSGAGGYYIEWADLETAISGDSYTTSTSLTAYIMNNDTYHVSVYAYTGSSRPSMEALFSTIGTATIEADGREPTADGLTVTCVDSNSYFCTLSCNQSSFSTDTIYSIYVDGAFLTAAEDTTQSFVLPSGSYEITVIASNTAETIGTLTLTIGDTSYATHDDEDYEYEYDSDGKAISRSITTYAEDGSYSVEYQIRVN